jgi:hypothetical protein
MQLLHLGHMSKMLISKRMRLIESVAAWRRRTVVGAASVRPSD